MHVTYDKPDSATIKSDAVKAIVGKWYHNGHNSKPELSCKPYQPPPPLMKKPKVIKGVRRGSEDLYCLLYTAVRIIATLKYGAVILLYVDI